MKFAVIVFTSIIWAVNDTIYPYLIKTIVDTLQNYQGDRANIYAVVKGTLVLLVLFWVGSEILQRTQGFIQLYVFPNFARICALAVFNYVKSHSHDYFSTHFAGNLSKKLSDLPTSSQAIVEIVCYQFVTAATGSVLVIIMMWLTQPIFAAIVMTWLIIHFVLTFLFLHYGDRLWEIHADSVSVLNGKIVDVLTNMLNVRLFARGKYEFDYLKKYQSDEIAKSKKQCG